MIEPMIAETIARTEPVPVVDWGAYGACSKVCRARTGQPCVAMSGRILAGRPDGVRRELPVPHAARRRLSRRPAR